MRSGSTGIGLLQGLSLGDRAYKVDSVAALCAHWAKDASTIAGPAGVTFLGHRDVKVRAHNMQTLGVCCTERTRCPRQEQQHPQLRFFLPRRTSESIWHCESSLITQRRSHAVQGEPRRWRSLSCDAWWSSDRELIAGPRVGGRSCGDAHARIPLSVGMLGRRWRAQSSIGGRSRRRKPAARTCATGTERRGGEGGVWVQDICPR